MYLFKNSGKEWHVLARVKCPTVGHIHPAPGLCYTHTKQVLTLGSRELVFSQAHEGVLVCGYCIDALLSRPGVLDMDCSNLPERSAEAHPPMNLKEGSK